MLEPYINEDITSGCDAIATTSVTILSGQNLAANTPLGQITASGKFTECKTDANNGSQTARYLTAQAIDATGGDVQAQVYKAGTFDPEMVLFDASFSAAEKLIAFVGTPISLQTKSAAL
jgi:TRAP-type mannitol/chloroaromatic compound transport system substrate-binding protein